MTITLTGIKYAAFASEETSCFEAKIRIDGEVVGTVRNSGKGGCNDYLECKFGSIKKMREHAASLPPIKAKFANESSVTFPMDLDLLIGELLEDHLTELDLRKKMKRQVLVTHKDKKGLWGFKRKWPDTDNPKMYALIRQRDATIEHILNEIPFGQAFSIFKKECS